MSGTARLGLPIIFFGKMELQTKICKKCQQTKSLELFRNQKSKKDGKRVVCKACDDAYLKENYQARRVYKKAIVKKWQSENPEKVADYKSKYYFLKVKPQSEGSKS